MENSTTLLNIISFQKLTNWSVRYLLDFTFNYNENFQLVSIGEFLTRNRNIINVQDETVYSRVTVRGNNNGVYLRDKEIGSKIGTKRQYIVNNGQFIISKIDARNGAMGIVPDDLEGAIVTSDFPTFSVDNMRINPQFLLLITTTKTFINFAQSCSSGTTNRQRINIEQFLNIKIPLPSLKEQDKIVAQYNKKIELANEQEIQATELEDNISHYIDKILGIKDINEDIQKKGIFLKVVKYSNFHKWGVDAQPSSKVSYNEVFEQSKISQICTISSGGTPSRSRKEYYKGNIPWIKTGEVVNDIIFETEEHITEEAIKNSSAKLYKKDSLIIAMYGQGKTRGRTAKLGIDATTNQACAVLYDIDNSKVLTDYLWVFLSNEYDRLRELASGNSQPNLNAQMIRNYPLVIPPISIQQNIIDTVFDLKNKIKILQNKAEKNKTNAIKEFEQKIFKPA